MSGAAQESVPDASAATPPGAPVCEAESGAVGGRSRIAIALNVLGFVLGLALLWWCSARALSASNRDQLALLWRAPWWQGASLVGVSLLNALCSAMVFRSAVSPVRRLPVLDVVCVNFVASLGNYMPFKLGLVFRVLTHNRRNGLALLTIGAWMGAMAVLMLCVLGPVMLAGLWRGRVDGAWWLAAAGGTLMLCTLVVLAARFVGGVGGVGAAGTGRGWLLVQRGWAALPMPRGFREKWGVVMLGRVREGTRMLGSPAAVAQAVAWRIGDLATQSLRFLIAATIIGRTLTWDQSILAGSTYYLIGSVSPTGQLGVREAGTAGIVGKLLVGIDFDAFSLIVLMVTAAELLSLLLGAGVSMLYLARRPVMAPVPVVAS